MPANDPNDTLPPSAEDTLPPPSGSDGEYEAPPDTEEGDCDGAFEGFDELEEGELE